MTYKEKVPEHNPESEVYGLENQGPYDHSKYAQCDFLLVRKSFQETAKDCESRVDLNRDSDHIPLVAETRTNMKKQQKTHGEKGAKKFYKPTQEKIEWYNQAVTELLRAQKGRTQESHMEENLPTLDEWVKTLEEAAEANLEKIHPEMRKDYISKETWENIQKN